MTSDQLASMYAEIVLGVEKADSRFAGEPDFDSAWDTTAAQVQAIQTEAPDAAFDIPNEVPDRL